MTIYDYPYIEGALVDSLRMLTTHFPHDWQVVQGSEDLLAKGADKFAVLNWMPESEEELSSVDKIVKWKTSVDLYCRWKTNEEGAKATIKVLQADIYDLFKVRKALYDIDGVTDTDVSSDVPQWIRINENDSVPVFITQRLIVEVTQYLEVP